MPDETRATGHTDRPGHQQLQPGEDGSQVLDDDVDFYDDEPAARGGSAISPPTEPGPDPAPQNPWREPGNADSEAAPQKTGTWTQPAALPVNQSDGHTDGQPGPVTQPTGEQEPVAAAPAEPTEAAEPTQAAEPEQPAAAAPEPEQPTVAATDQPAPVPDQPAAATPEAEQPTVAVPDPNATLTATEPGFDNADTPTSQQPYYEPARTPHRTTRVAAFDDLADENTDFIGGLRLPSSIESELEGKGRPSWRPPLLVWIITGLFVSLAAMCTFLYPTFTGYDEPFHVDMTYSYYNGNGFYAPGGRYLSIGVQNANGAVHPPPTVPFTQQHVVARGQRQSFDALGGDKAGTYPIPNQMVQHPPLYYVIGAAVLHLIPGSHNMPYDQWVAVLRYLSILMVAPLPILAWASAKALVGDGPAAVAASALPLTLPNLARVGGNVNNDNLLTLLTAVLILLLCKVLAGDLRKRMGFWVGLVTGLACLTKGYALVLPVVVLVAYAIAWMRHRRRTWAPFGVAAATTAVVGAWWWIRNLILYGTVQPEGFGGKGSYGYDTFYMTAKHAPPGRFTIDQFIPAYLSRVLWRTWGGIGYPEQPFFSRTTTWVWFGIVAAGAVFAVFFGFRGRFGRLSAAMFVLPTILILSLPMYNAEHHFLYNGVLPGAQGRYLYPSATAVAVLLGVGYTRLIGRKLSAWLPLVVIIGAIGTQILAWRQLVKVWWVPTNVHGKSEEFKQAFRGILRWSPWPHAVTTIPFVAVLAFAVAVLAAGIAYGVVHRNGDDEPVITDGGTMHDPLPARSFANS